jgi:pimeloyl-ACP methyl ester carboxylesterase
VADIVLIAGLWLEASAWDAVARELEQLGHLPIPVRLPGVDDGSTTATLDDQLDAVLRAVDSAVNPLVVGHSAASTLAWMAADRRPEAVRQVMLVGGFPTPDGQPYADFFDIVDGTMPFPGWRPFEGPDSVDLDEETKERFAATAVPVPGGVASAVVELVDERRYDVAVTVVCPEFSPDDARQWIEAGDIPELARARRVDFVDIDSGHWPMITCPDVMARAIHDNIVS